MSLASRLKSSRKKLGLSQAELAERIDVSQPTIANWERGGHTPRNSTLGKIAKALGTDSAWLLSGEYSAKNNPAHRHLAKAIHHIPVYEWPTGTTDPTDTQAVRYMAIAADMTNMFALQWKGQGSFPPDTILVFTKIMDTRTGDFLVTRDDRLDVVSSPSLSENVLGRLIYSVVPH